MYESQYELISLRMQPTSDILVRDPRLAPTFRRHFERARDGCSTCSRPLRRHRHRVAGTTLAQARGISLRTLYRDIATLPSQGAHIDGEPGVGHVLRPGFMLPPLMFSQDEIEALVLGSRWVAERADGLLAEAARTAPSRIAAVLPDDLRESLDAKALLVRSAPRSPLVACGDAVLRAIRLATGCGCSRGGRHERGSGRENGRSPACDRPPLRASTSAVSCRSGS